MNDLKLNVIAQSGQPNGNGSAGQSVTSSVPQPGTSRSSETSEKSNTQKAQETDQSEKPSQPQAAQASKENQNQQKQQIQEAVAKLNDYIQSVQRDLEFNLDDESGRVVVKVVDRKTSEVVRQIPDEVALKLAHNLQSEEPISLLNTKA